MLRQGPHMQRAKGFSLVEVMVALVIVAIGLLGLAKMESLALSSTGVASGRQLAALEASSMAAMMHANRAYWATAIAPATTTVNTTTATTAPTTMCNVSGTPCTAANVALYDEWQWANGLSKVLPNFLGTITCSTSTLPVTCTITVQWAEAGVAISATQQTNINNLAVPTYTVFVEP
jgi:type IV pilus assembly protein PilV